MPRASTRFDGDAAGTVEKFFHDRLTHLEGVFAGRPFDLLPWQSERIIRPLFGTMRYDAELKDWVRSYRTAYVEIPRKNGKSALGAGIGLYLLTADGEAGAQVFNVAEDLDQARRIFDMAKGMVEASPILSKRCKAWNRVIEYKAQAGDNRVYRVIPADAAGNHGHNPHGVIFDELHTQKSRDLWDVMTSGQGMRAQPLTVAFTTAGTDRTTICWDQHDYGEKVAARILQDPSFLYVRFGIEEGEDWQDEETWEKANPALGHFLLKSFLRSEFAKAKQSPGRENTFRNLYLDEWTHQVTRYIPMDAWHASAGLVVEEDLARKTCHGGLDVGSSMELASFVMAFPNEDRVETVCRFWMPGEDIEDKEIRDRLPYRTWAKEGWLTLTPGRVIDYPAIRAGILEDAERFDLQSVAFRRAGAVQLVGDLEDHGLDLIPITATASGMDQATRDLLELVLAGRLTHGGNPILDEMADAMTVKVEVDGLIKPDQKNSGMLIPGMLALIRALDRTLRSEELGPLVMVAG